MQLVLATNNQDKIKEIKQLLDDLPITILTRDDFLEFPDVEETGKTLEENAILKAKTIFEFTDIPALADDTGLEVDALNGAPGVYSARYAGEGATYKENNLKLLQELEEVKDEKRTAHFRCVLALVWAEDDIDIVNGLAEGIIAHKMTGDHGFGYDPVFYYPPLKKRFSEMTTDEKNIISHRGKALQEIRTVIINKLNQKISD